ncbi:hypothetical protein BC629DRAFT_1152730 [Irpex lacteus]|nr:hypothetical protein BC629DRAFT_1152730 [Irpex lacteus]
MASLPLRRKARIGRAPDDGVVSRARLITSDTAEIISAISKRRVVRKVLLDGLDLVNDGWTEVFDHLRSLPSSQSDIVEIDLRGCRLKDNDLLAISAFLTNNQTLKCLWLQNNCFDFARRPVESLISAVNSSHLETLRLGTNPNHGAFVPRLLGGLNTRYLHNLELSHMGLDITCVPQISDFLTSPRCHLRTLRLNGNEFSLDDAQKIHHALRSNYSLTTFEMYSVNLHTDEDRETMKEYTKERAKLLTRNQILQRRVSEDALALLRHSRAALLPSSIPSPSPAASHKSLPTEILLHILSFFSPTLSSSQRIRIFDFASTRSTLPPLLPRLPVTTCLPDPSAPPGPGGGCSENCCMGSAHFLSCRRESERAQWLMDMQCDAFDPGEGEEIRWDALAST